MRKATYTYVRTIIVSALLYCNMGYVFAQQPSLLNSQGVIHNTGVVKIYGDAALSQDTILGRVEYLRNRGADQRPLWYAGHEAI